MKENKITKENELNELLSDVKFQALDIYKKNIKIKQMELELKELKSNFNKLAIDYYDKSNEKEKTIELLYDVLDTSNKINRLTVTKIQGVNIKFDVDALEKRLTRTQREWVIQKRYEIFDIQGLVEYLKGCNVDPNVFKSFLIITKEINMDELERLESINQIKEETLIGTYTTNLKEPYFKIQSGKRKG